MSRTMTQNLQKEKWPKRIRPGSGTSISTTSAADMNSYSAAAMMAEAEAKAKLAEIEARSKKANSLAALQGE